MEIPRFEKQKLNPRLVATDIGDAFQGFVHELLLSEHPQLHRFPGGGKDGGIDLIETSDTCFVVECKVVGEDDTAAAGQRWKKVRRNLEEHLRDPNGPTPGQSQYGPWYSTDTPITEYVFSVSAEFKNEEQRRDLKKEIEDFFHGLAGQRPHLSHFARIEVSIIDWSDLCDRLRKRPHTIFRWFPESRPNGLVPIDEAVDVGTFRAYLGNNKSPYYSLAEHLGITPASEGIAILDEERLLTHFENPYIREYRQAFSPDQAQVIDATKMEIPYWLMTYSELTDLLIDRTELSAHNQTAFFRDTVNTLKQREGKQLGLPRTTVDTPIFFSLEELKKVVQGKNEEMVQGATKLVKGPMHGDFDRFIMRLDSRLNDNRYDFLLKPTLRNNSNSLEALLREFIGLGKAKAPIVVIDLSPVPFDVRPTVTAQIGRLAFEFNYWNPMYEEFPILLVCEEAHAYVAREKDSQFEGARKSMERIAKEGRKYGVGLTIVSQRPHEVSETVLSQCGTFICLRITNPDDQEYVRKLVPEAERDLVNILAGMRRGEALVLGEAAPMPTRVQIDIPSPTPRSNDIDFYKHWIEGPEDLDIAAIVDRWRRQIR